MITKLPVSGLPIEVDFDPDLVRQKYAEERAKRLRPDGANQWLGLGDTVEIDSSDPWSEPIDREPQHLHLDAVVLGGGFGGLLAAAELTKLGVTSFRIVEQGGDFGGTWYWNRYPGLQCDIESYLYLPLLEETGYIPTSRWVFGPEILEHARRIGRHFELYERALFQTTVSGAEWNGADSVWVVRTNRGDVIEARHLLRANGPLNKPQIPRVPGIADFAGKIMHTARWDYEYTGGNPDGGLDKLADKRVAIVGTGATGIQAVAPVATSADKLYVVQRTPTNVGPRHNEPTDPQWAASLRPNWRAERMHNHIQILNGYPQEENLVADAWTWIFGEANGQHLVDVPVSTLALEDQIAVAELADMIRVQQAHRRIEEEIDDPQLAELLKPWYGVMCKRPCFNDDFYPALNRDNVELVASPQGLERITADGFVVDGVHHEVDLIIFATGFETGTSHASRYGYDLIGRDGISLREYYADGNITLHGFLTPNFPNYLELGVSQNGFTVNVVYMLEQKARHAARLVAHAVEHGIAQMEATEDAALQWRSVCMEVYNIRSGYWSMCTPGYYNGQGDADHAFFLNMYLGNEADYWVMIDNWWDQGTFAGVTLTAAQQDTAAARS
ncbi:monooxygenase [Mycobacterium sp. MS1601]|uniref:flavin-containing monooxygenase n=1 Tax=Mycobacterium sp. MS1601 TaxID=1936029 RepID=UPI00097914BA|nr:NAD(P)/FAD-dependent oxidoreductase [Mycobacterium sp. MS1601]AQA04615.1 monooxygenase [Mycobacterium sp. MS1601]